MKITIRPVIVGEEETEEANVSLSSSNGIAIRVVPVLADGSEATEEYFGFFGDESKPEYAKMISAIRDAVQDFVTEQGR